MPTRVPYRTMIVTGATFSVLGIVMNAAWDRLSESDAAPAYLPLLEHGFLPVFVTGMLALSAGCVALSRESLPPRNYLAAGLCTSTVPVTALLLRLHVLQFDLAEGFQDWPMMFLVLMVDVFALGLMFLVAAMSWRKWE